LVEAACRWNGTQVYVAPLVIPFSTTTGAVVSTTETVKLPSAVLLRLFVAEQFTVLPPSANCDPDGGIQVTTRFVSRASVAVAVKFTMAPAGLVASAVVFAGRCSHRRRWLQAM